MPILMIRKGFTLSHGQQVFVAGDVIECDDKFAAGVAHMTEPAKGPDAAKRATLIRTPKPAAQAPRTDGHPLVA